MAQQQRLQDFILIMDDVIGQRQVFVNCLQQAVAGMAQPGAHALEQYAIGFVRGTGFGQQFGAGFFH